MFDEVTKRQPHVDSKEDAARRARGLYVSAPTYDYTGTGRLRLHLTEHDRKMRNYFTDTATMRVEDKLDAVLDVIEAATQQAIRWKEERRRREEEEAARRREAQRIAELRHEYEKWEKALTEGAAAWREHQQLSAYVASVEQLAPDGSQQFIQWAHGYLAATDPRLRLPAGEVPTWTHEQRVRHGAYVKPQWGW